MDIWLAVRVASLTGERLAYRLFGRRQASPWPVMGAAYIGAALFLWAAAGAQGHWGVDWQAFWPSMAYAAAFGLYTSSLVTGQASQVSPWSNATAMMLFILHPADWRGVSWLFMGLFGIGAWCQVQGRLSWPVLMMVASDMLLVVGRLGDVHAAMGNPWTYGASLMTFVAVWMGLAIAARGELPAVFRVVAAYPLASAATGLLNAVSYVSVVVLLESWPATLVEASSAVAALAAAVIAPFLFQERATSRRIGGAVLMTLSAVLLLWDYHRTGLYSGWRFS